ncbi:MAG: PAS domain-containing sensor histidine kinase [Bacteroidales bacterium]|jgi:PAS domain S-box-containing protein
MKKTKNRGLGLSIIRKKVEEELRRSEEKYRLVFENVQDGYFEVSLAGTILEVSPSIELVSNGQYTREDLIGKQMTDFYANPAERAGYLATLKAFGSVTDYEVALRNRDGSFLLCAISSKMSLDETGQPEKMIGSIRNISERKRAEELLKKNEEKYRSIFENVQDGYFEVAFDGTILEVSPSIEMISNGQYRREDLLGKSMFSFYADPAERNAYLATMQERGKVVDYEVSLLNKDGTFIPCAISSKVFVDENGKPDKLIGSIRNITERKVIESELIAAKNKAEENNRLKSAFLNNMSHEIRTPMNAIMGFTDLLIDSECEDKNRYASIVYQGTNQLLNLIDNVVLLSRMQSEKLPVNLTRFKPADVVQTVFRMFDLPEFKLDLALFVTIPDGQEELVIHSDSDKISKVLINLVSNAVKYTREGSVEIGFTLVDHTIEFFVKDTGTGISETDQARIFDPFYRGDQVVKAAIRGSGLGLNISKILVDMLGGTIGVKSAPNEGSRFHFTVPFTD